MPRQRGAAAPQEQAALAVEATAGEMTLAEIRREQLANVPSMEAITQMAPAEEEINIYLVPLRGGAAAAAIDSQRRQ